MPDPIDYAAICPRVAAALERRHAGRRAGELPRQIPALAIARRFGIRPFGSDDSRKRGVRRVIDRLREDGTPVLATFRGYYLGGETADWSRYEEFRRRSGLSHLVGAAQAVRSDAAIDATGQLALFSAPGRRR